MSKFIGQFCLGALIAIANALLLTFLIRKKSLAVRKRRLFVGNQALADLICGLALAGLALAELTGWYDKQTWTILDLAVVCSFYLSVFNHTCTLVLVNRMADASAIKLFMLTLSAWTAVHVYAFLHGYMVFFVRRYTYTLAVCQTSFFLLCVCMQLLIVCCVDQWLRKHQESWVNPDRFRSTTSAVLDEDEPSIDQQSCPQDENLSLWRRSVMVNVAIRCIAFCPLCVYWTSYLYNKRNFLVTHNSLEYSLTLLSTVAAMISPLVYWIMDRKSS